MADEKIYLLDKITTPDNNDVMPIDVDPAGTPITKGIIWANIKATLKTYLDMLYADSGVNADITSMTGITGVISTPTNLGNKTTAAWSKSIGSGGDYATWAAMIADMPDLIAHAVTVTIKAGTTLTETCSLKNKHGLTSGAAITIKAEKYYPTSGEIPTADSATATTLRDAALAAAAKGNDYFNGCWVFIVDGTGTDNGFVPITDYVDATGDVIVASWPGTQPDNTSRYLIVGALFDGEATRRAIDLEFNGCKTTLYGMGFTRGSSYGRIQSCTLTSFLYCGVYKTVGSGIRFMGCLAGLVYYSGLVDNSTHGLQVSMTNRLYVHCDGISDNTTYGVVGNTGSFIIISSCFGNVNGTWGVYVSDSAQAQMVGTECSGSSGNHSDPGTAGTAGADQASAY